MSTKHLKTKTAEAVQEGIITTLVDINGEVIERNLIQYADAIRSLDKGDYDEERPASLRIAAVLLEAQAAGFYKPDNEAVTIFYRWLVADIFIRTMEEENGTAPVQQPDGSVIDAPVYIGEHGAMVVYPFVERLALAKNIEAAAFSHPGVNNGYVMATNVYQSMIDEDFSLSERGREMLETLHDGYIQDVIENGLPPEPATH